MSSTQLSGDGAADAARPATLAMKFEVTTLPVADVDRAKAFYQRLGRRLATRGVSSAARQEG